MARALLLLAASLLVACGQAGDLYLRSDPPAAEAPAADPEKPEEEKKDTPRSAGAART